MRSLGPESLQSTMLFDGMTFLAMLVSTLWHLTIARKISKQSTNACDNTSFDTGRQSHCLNLTASSAN